MPQPRRSFLVFALLALGAVAGCEKKATPGPGDAPPAPTAAPTATPEAPVDGDTILFGEVGSLTGAQATFGISTKNGVQMAIDEVNAAGGVTVDGKVKKIAVRVYDDQGKSEEAANAVSRLINQDKVVVILGEVASSNSLAMAPKAQAAKIPMITPSSTNPKVTEVGDYIFRVCFIDPYQGAGAATYAIKSLGLKKAALLVDVANDYSVGLANYFKKSFGKLGGEIVTTLNYQSGDQDFTAQLTKIISQKPDVLFIPSYFAEGAIIMKQAQELGATFKIMGGDAMDNPKITEIGGKAVEGFVHTTFPYDPSMKDMNPMAKKFTEDWKKIHPGKDPNVNAALGYDAYMIILDAITRAGKVEPEAITKALAETKGFVGVTGATTINASHDAEKPVGLVLIKDGKKTYVGDITPDL